MDDPADTAGYHKQEVKRAYTVILPQDSLSWVSFRTTHHAKETKLLFSRSRQTAAMRKTTTIVFLLRPSPPHFAKQHFAWRVEHGSLLTDRYSSTLCEIVARGPK
jgi:hypothetical protein